ncbi:MAG: PAS domain-containing protein, partial [Anaerolineae bacterium]
MQFTDSQLALIRECAKDEQSYQTLLEMLGQSQEARYRVLTEMMTDYTYAYKVLPNGQYELEWIEGAFSQITGYTPEEWEAGGLSSFVHPDDTHFTEHHLQFLAAGHAYEDEYRIITKDGQVRWIHDYAKPVLDPDTREVTRVIGASRDITRQKVAEAFHQEAQKRLRLLADYSSDIITIQSPEGYFEYLSPSVHHVAGFAPHDLLGKQ